MSLLIEIHHNKALNMKGKVFTDGWNILLVLDVRLADTPRHSTPPGEIRDCIEKLFPFTLAARWRRDASCF